MSRFPTGLLRSHGPEVAAVLVVTIWGVNFSFKKAALEEFDVLPFTAVRYVGMLILGWSVLVWQWRVTGRWVWVARSDLPRFVLSGVLGYAVYQLLSTVGLSYSSAFSNSLLLGTSPIFAALLLAALRLERIGVWQVLGIGTSFIGVAIFILEKAQATAGLGDVITLAAALAFAAYSVVNKPLVGRYEATAVSTFTLSIGAIPVLLLSLPATAGQDWGRVSPAGWGAMAWSIVLPVYVAYTVWGWVIGQVGVARTSIFMYLVPIIGGGASWLLLGEGFGILKISGAVMTLAGLFVASHRPPAERESPHVPQPRTVTPAARR